MRIKIIEAVYNKDVGDMWWKEYIRMVSGASPLRMDRRNVLQGRAGGDSWHDR